MQKQLSKALFTIGALTLTALGFSDNRADYNYPARGVDSDCPAPKPEPVCDPCSSRQRMEDMQDRIITPDAGPRVCNGADLMVSADFIYWKSQMDALAFAEKGFVVAAVVNTEKGQVYSPNFDWDPGFKVGAGLAFEHDGWDVSVQYTWLRSNPSTKSISNPFTATPNTDTNVLGAIWSIAGINFDTVMIFTSAKWKLSFNAIDTELARNYYISKYLTLRPFIGFKGTWQHDNYTVRYTQNNGTLSQYRMRNNIEYWGFGLRMGSNNAWYMMRNFCIFGDWALSALWGEFDFRRKDFSAADSSNLDNTFIRSNYKWNVYTIKAVLEFALGLRYDFWWSNDDYHFGISAAWEEQIWFDRNQHFNIYDESSHGDLVLHGLTLKVRFDF